MNKTTLETIEKLWDGLSKQERTALQTQLNLDDLELKIIKFRLDATLDGLEEYIKQLNADSTDALIITGMPQVNKIDQATW